jgi:hypothetical protein
MNNKPPTEELSTEEIKSHLSLKHGYKFIRDGEKSSLLMTMVSILGSNR